MAIAHGTQRELVTLQTPGGTIPDGEGGWTQEMIPLDPAAWWCAMRRASLRDLERLTAGTTLSTATHILEGDFHPGITRQTQVLVEHDDATTRTLYVADVINVDERDRHTIVLAQEIVP